MAIDISKYKVKANNPAKKTSSGIMELMNKDIQLFGGGLNDRKKERFYSDLHILFSSGVDIKSALELIVEQQKKTFDKELFEGIKADVENGKSISEALLTTQKFTQYEYYSIKIGEETGRLSEVLKDLSDYYEGKIGQKQQFVNALSYPVIVLLTAIGVTFFMLKVMIPSVSELFTRFGADLPTMTKMIIRASEIFTKYFWISFVLIVGLVVGLFISRKMEWFRKYASAFLLKIPVLNELIRKIYLARFCHSMNLLMSAKTPLTEALDMVKDMIGYYPIESSLSEVKNDIIRGQQLHESLKKFPIYNSRMISLIKVAAEVNQMDVVMKRLSDQYSQDVNHQTKLLNNILGPVMLILIGAFVMFILIALYMPMFQMGTVLQ